MSLFLFIMQNKPGTKSVEEEAKRLRGEGTFKTFLEQGFLEPAPTRLVKLV